MLTHTGQKRFATLNSRSENDAQPDSRADLPEKPRSPLTSTLKLMQLRTPTFSVALEARRRADDEDWARVRIDVRAGGFTGAFDAWLQSGDLDNFSNQLAALYENVGHAGEARLACAERGIDISLSMEKMGGINGQFEFFDERTSTSLSGSFTIDQSYLPEWRNRVESFAQELRQHAL
jgi:hypothetical protein